MINTFYVICLIRQNCQFYYIISRNVWSFAIKLLLSFFSFFSETGNGDDMASRSTVITIVVLTIVFLTCVGVILPLLFYKHKYLNSKFSNKILPKSLKPKNAKVKPEKGDDLQTLPDASTSGINPPDLLNSCGDNPSTSSKANGLL